MSRLVSSVRNGLPVAAKRESTICSAWSRREAGAVKVETALRGPDRWRVGRHASSGSNARDVSHRNRPGRSIRARAKPGVRGAVDRAFSDPRHPGQSPPHEAGQSDLRHDLGKTLVGRRRDQGEAIRGSLASSARATGDSSPELRERPGRRDFIPLQRRLDEWSAPESVEPVHRHAAGLGHFQFTC